MGVLDKFLDAIKLNDEDEDYLDDEEMMDDDDFLDDEDELETKPRKKFFEKFSRKSTSDDLDDETDDLDDLDEFDDVEPEPVVKKRPAKTVARPASRPAAKAAPEPAARPTVTSRAASAPKERSERAPRQSSKVTPMRSSKRSQNGNMEVCVIKPTSMENTREIADTLLDNSTVILNLEGIDVELAQRIIDFTSGACYSLGGTLQKISSYIFVLGPYNVDITGDLQNILGGSVPSVRAGY